MAQVREKYRIVVLGDRGVGKSALIRRLVSGFCFFLIKLGEYKEEATIEDGCRRDAEIDQEWVTLDILDTSGRDEFPALVQESLRGNIFLLLYDITSETSFDKVSKLYERIQKSKEVGSYACVLAGNKCDLKDERKITVKLSDTVV